MNGPLTGLGEAVGGLSAGAAWLGLVLKRRDQAQAVRSAALSGADD